MSSRWRWLAAPSVGPSLGDRPQRDVCRTVISDAIITQGDVTHVIRIATWLREGDGRGRDVSVGGTAAPGRLRLPGPAFAG